MDGSSETHTEIYEYTLNPYDGSQTRTVTTPFETGMARTSYRYDAWQRVVGVTNALEETSTRVLSGGGLVLREQGGAGGFYEYGYDTQGRMNAAGREREATVKVTYNADGTIASKTDRNGVTTSYTYDGRGLVERASTALGETRYSYDAAGRLVRQEKRSHGGGTTYYTEYVYDDAERRVTVIEGGRYTTTYLLNAWGETTQATSGGSLTRTYSYDGAGRLSKTTDGYGNETNYTWNALGKVASIAYPDGNTETYEYTHLGKVRRITDAIGVQWEGEYDAAGRLSRERGRPGIDKAYRYDALGRVVEVKTGGEVVERYAYGDRGRRVVFTDGAGNAYEQEKNAYAELTSETNRLGEDEPTGR